MVQSGRARFHSIVTHWLFWVGFVTGIAIIIRSIPAWTHVAWGCDFGIYYGLTNSFVESKELFNAYSGWGMSYQYFPVLYVITGVAHWITGLDVLTVMPKLAPIFGGLSVLIFYFVVYELLGDRKKALLASLFLAVLPFHVYQTSHAAPLTIGHFFMMLSLYFFIKSRSDLRYSIPLLCSTILLVMSHHLTTYFYLISLIAIVFIENAGQKKWTETVTFDSVYVLVTSGIVFSYWMLVAKPVYATFMHYGLKLGPIRLSSTVVLLFYIGFFSFFGIIWLKRRLNLFLKPSKPTAHSSLKKFAISLVIMLTAMGVFSIVPLPWTNFKFPVVSIVYSLPLLVMISFGVAGFRSTRFVKNGLFIRGWLLALLVSFVFVLLTNNITMPPDRHLEYIMVPLSIMSVFGIETIFLSKSSHRFRQWQAKFLKSSYVLPVIRNSRFVKKHQPLLLLMIFALVASNAVSVYPSFVSLNAAYEEFTDEDMAVLHWMQYHLNNSTTVIASDHRLARMAEALGLNTTLDEASLIWTAENLTEYWNELKGINKNYSQITHIIIDDIMREHVVHVYFGNMQYMTNASYDKFSSPFFTLVYRNETVDSNGVAVHWSEIYEVNWSFIENQGAGG